MDVKVVQIVRVTVLLIIILIINKNRDLNLA